MIRAFISLALFGQAAAGQAQPPAKPPAPDLYEYVTVEIHPTAPPVPAMRYRLMPAFGEQISGNAATGYLLALERLPVGVSYQDLSELIESPQLDKAKSLEVVQKFSMSFQHAELASRMDRCDWGLPLRDQGTEIKLPYLSQLRMLSNGLSLRIRLEIADRQFDRALADLRTGFALARHVSEGGVMVQALVATGIDAIFLGRMVDFQKAQGAPNLFWALANLPRPLINQQPIFDVERGLFFASFPELAGRRFDQLDDNDYQLLFRGMVDLPDRNAAPQKKSLNSTDLAIAMIPVYERAKRKLIEAGRTPEQVDQLPVRTVLGSYLLNNYLKWADEMDKWAGLPYSQSREGMAGTIKAMRAQDELQGNPLSRLIPNVDRAVLQFARVQRMEAEVECVEGLRAFAAAHDGKLPVSLDELVDTPAPLDPITGKSFVYESHGTSATLTSTPIPGERYKSGKIMQISVK